MSPASNKVTVLMPVYNGEKYLRAAIDSILTQTFRDFEFLIIDDGSQDNSEDIVRSYKDNRIALAKNEKNMGLEATLNRGILLANGEYIARMDCDDVSLPHRLEKQVAFMDSHPEVAVCGAQATVFGRRSGLFDNPLEHEAIRCRLLFESVLAHPTVMLRRVFLVDNHLFYDDSKKYKTAEDYELWVRVSQIGRLANVDDILLQRRVHHSSIGSTQTQFQVNQTDVIREEQLKGFGIQVTQDTLVLHSKIARCSYEPTMQFLEQSEKWLLTLVTTNSDRQVYEDHAFAKEIAFRWWKVCKNLFPLGLRAFNAYWRSPLSKEIALSWTQKFIFFSRCLLKK
jgi:glycosyltransferase involved in cell wall biosynthesis